MTDFPSNGHSSTKSEILRLLKGNPDTALAEIASRLAISKVAALRHLERLESDGLVGRSYLAGRVGRPRVIFRLTPAAAPLFPHAYTEFSLCALDFIEHRLGREAVSEMLSRRAGELADRDHARIPSGPLPARVERLARIRTEGGYMAELGPRRSTTVEMLEHNCPILAVAERYPESCEAERRLFESLLRARVTVSHRVVSGDPVCRFVMRERPPPG